LVQHSINEFISLSKSFNKLGRKLVSRRLWLAVMGLLLLLIPARAQTSEPVAVPHYLGAPSCASSACHGGGGSNQNQYLVWSQRDFHSQRPVATLATARSRQIAAALAIPDPAADTRCTTCHAPLDAVPAARRGPGFSVAEGVSCETCHGPAENWLRAHTRTDWTHADRVAAGLRDLQNLYVRANTCVACHQTVSLALLSAGHPEGMFELDGQSAAEPRHWTESAASSHAQIWFVGQAAALRELSWQLSREPRDDDRLIARWRALLWLLQKLDGLNPALTGLKNISPEARPENYLAAQRAADSLARAAATSSLWNDALARQALIRLTGTAGEFVADTNAGELPARRAERLVLALDRLLLAQNAATPASSGANHELDELFKLAQSVPDFRPADFATALTRFAATLKNQP
jgi:hypothetical protein